MATSVRLPEETEARLDHLAANTGRPKSFSLRELIEKNLDKLEWEYSLAQKAVDIRASPKISRDCGATGSVTTGLSAISMRKP